jgi:hypothetical protein
MEQDKVRGLKETNDEYNEKREASGCKLIKLAEPKQYELEDECNKKLDKQNEIKDEYRRKLGVLKLKLLMLAESKQWEVLNAANSVVSIQCYVTYTIKFNLGY